MDLQDGWMKINQELRLDYFETDRSVWLATRAWEMRRNHILANEIEFRLNGQKLTPTAAFITGVMPRWKTFVVESMQNIDVQGLVVFTILHLEGGMRVPKVLPPETYTLYVRHNVNTVSDEYKVTRVLTSGVMGQIGSDVTAIKPITWRVGQTRPDYSQDFPSPNENDNTVYVMGGFGFDPLTTGVMTSRVSRYHQAWKKYQLYHELHMVHLQEQVRPTFYVKMAAVPEHVMNNAIFSETTAQLGNLSQNAAGSRDTVHQKRVEEQFKAEQRMVDESNRRGGLLVPENPEDVMQSGNARAVGAYLAGHGLVPLPPGTDLVSITRPTPQFNLAEARSEITAHISSAYGTTPALWEQTSTMKGNVELFESVLTSTMKATIKVTMEAASQIFNELHIGATHSEAILANYERYMRPQMQAVLYEKLTMGDDHSDGRSGASCLPFGLRAAQAEEQIYDAGYWKHHRGDSDSDSDESDSDESESEDDVQLMVGGKKVKKKKKKKTTTGKRKRSAGKSKSKVSKTLKGGEFDQSTLSENRARMERNGADRGWGHDAARNAEEEEIPSTMQQLQEFAQNEAVMTQQVEMFVEKIPERKTWVDDQLEAIKQRSSRAYYTLTVAPYGSRQTNDEILATFLGGSMTAAEVIQKTRNNSSLHQEDMTAHEFEVSVQYLEKLKAASSKEFMTAQYAKMMQEAGVGAASTPSAAKQPQAKPKPKAKAKATGGSDEPKAKTDTDKAKQTQKGTGTSMTDKQAKDRDEKKEARKETAKSSDTKKKEKQHQKKK